LSSAVAGETPAAPQGEGQHVTDVRPAERLLYRERSAFALLAHHRPVDGSRSGRFASEVRERRADADAGQEDAGQRDANQHRLREAPPGGHRVAVCPFSAVSGQRGSTSKAWSAGAPARPRCKRMAAASAIMAPLSVHNASSG
jgi:hypothetical protein